MLVSQRAASFLSAEDPHASNARQWGPPGGCWGLCGEQSNHCFIFPFLARALQVRWPDVAVHAFVEHVGSMFQPHKEAILASLGLGPQQAVTIDVAD